MRIKQSYRQLLEELIDNNIDRLLKLPFYRQRKDQALLIDLRIHDVSRTDVPCFHGLMKKNKKRGILGG